MQNLTERQIATVLAALRFWQRKGDRMESLESNIATSDREFEPLTLEEIDHLCEEINMVSKPGPAASENDASDPASALVTYQIAAQGHLRAIQARIEGIFDDPFLAAYGPLSSDTLGDVKGMIKVGPIQPAMIENEISQALSSALQLLRSLPGEESSVRAADGIDAVCQKLTKATSLANFLIAPALSSEVLQAVTNALQEVKASVDRNGIVTTRAAKDCIDAYLLLETISNHRTPGRQNPV